jgi:hypothetical protein
MVVLFLLCALVCFASGQIAIGGGGLDDPSLFHQRYRGDESFFSGSEFFQWWFFWVKATNKDGSTSLTQKNLFFFRRIISPFTTPVFLKKENHRFGESPMGQFLIFEPKKTREKHNLHSH